MAKVLVVDDEQAITTLLKYNLEKAGSPKGGRGGVEVPAGRREMQKGGDKCD